MVQVEPATGPGAPQRHTPGSRPAPSTPFELSLQEEHLYEVGAGWAKRKVHQLGLSRRAIVLHGYGLATWEWSRVMDESLAPFGGLAASLARPDGTVQEDAS
ncbi:hypothetical protein [Streptomyces chartreusis]|uniref:hypothetical protein n=1 Tax=Streptomyces chartreusis TaxID=1969 RepID=UPI00380F2773